MIAALPWHLLRDLFLALFVAVPIAGAVGALLAIARHRSRAAPPVVVATGAQDRATTRRGFLTYGAAGVTTVAGTAYGTSRWWSESALAAEDTCSANLVINEGYRRMIDGTPVFMRGFGVVMNNGFGTPGPRVPGPRISPGGSVAEGQLATIKEGCLVTVTIQNLLNERHSFSIEDPVGDPIPVETDPPGETQFPVFIEPGKTKAVKFTPPRPGTYLYQDVLPAQRLLGLHGVMVVMPADDTTRPYVVTSGSRFSLPSPPTFAFQYCWVLHDIDPIWGELARLGRPIDDTTCLPRYFTINGASAGNDPGDANKDRGTVPVRKLGEACLIRIVNAGAAVHSCHFHGNHVFVVSDNHDAPFTTDDGVVVALQKDVIVMGPGDVKDMLLPCHEPLDQYPPYDPETAFLNEYPMHCHAEMSQTAAGGNYPSGMLTDWELETESHRGPRPVGS